MNTTYQELAKELAKWQERQGDLIAFLENLREQEYVITPLKDKDEDGTNFLLKEIDPFTFFGVFNRGIKNEQRIAILGQIKRLFNLQNALPEDFAGIPILNNQKSWFISYQETGLLVIQKNYGRFFCWPKRILPFRTKSSLKHLTTH